jgi:hypothetical protein
MTLKPKDKQLAQVLTAIRTQVGPGRSPLYRWMRQRHADLAAAFDETPPAWGVFAAQMTALGITDADGKPPTAIGARQTWYRVRRDVAARAAKLAQTAIAAPLTPSEIAPGVHSVASQPAPQAPRAVAKFDIRPARPRDAALALPADGGAPGRVAAPLAAATPSQESGLNDQMRRVSEAMDADNTPMPRVTR